MKVIERLFLHISSGTVNIKSVNLCISSSYHPAFCSVSFICLTSSLSPRSHFFPPARYTVNDAKGRCQGVWRRCMPGVKIYYDHDPLFTSMAMPLVIVDRLPAHTSLSKNCCERWESRHQKLSFLTSNKDLLSYFSLEAKHDQKQTLQITTIWSDRFYCLREAVKPVISFRIILEINQWD